MASRKRKARDDVPMSHHDVALNQAVRLVQGCLGDQIADCILTCDVERRIYLVAMLVDRRDDDSEPVGGDCIEYQVSDGVPGKRSESRDFYTLREALAEFRRIQQVGWRA